MAVPEFRESPHDIEHHPSPLFFPNPGPTRSYPKHVWSPSGGWYAQPANWKRNTAIAGAVIFGITAAIWKLSAELEYRHQMPEPDRFFPSR